MATARKTHHHNPVVLTLIALFKLVKGAMLLVVGMALFRLIHQDLHEAVVRWVNELRLDPENHFIHAFLQRCIGVQPHTLREASVGTLIYAGLYLTEGIGLLGDRLWAEWLTVITTAGFVPLELYEVSRHFTLIRVGLLVVNLLVLAYLVRRLIRRHRQVKAAEKTTPE